MPFTISLRKAALGLLLVNSVVTAQLHNGHDERLPRNLPSESKRSLSHYVDGIVKRVNAAGKGLGPKDGNKGQH
jgi:hypothetical protein